MHLERDDLQKYHICSEKLAVTQYMKVIRDMTAFLN